MDGLRMRKATRDDLSDVRSILNEAAQWLASIGVQQWPSPFPRIVVERDLEQNTIWLFTLDQRPVATASVLTYDPMFWGDLGDAAWYLHRLAIRRSAAGIGRAVLDLIEDQAIKSGTECVRLDCGVGLRSYYEDAGYNLRSWLSLLGAASSPPRSEWFCYEKLLMQA